jgi:MFS family permease
VPERHPTLTVLAQRDVRNFVTARFFSRLGHSLVHATLHWHLWRATDSPFYLGLLGLIEFLPVIPLSLVAGALADSRDRRKIVIAAQGVTVLAVVALLTGSLAGTAEVPLLLGTALLLSMASCFENPAGAALLPALVSRELFPAATVVSSNVRNVASVSGPVLMGLITAYGGIPSAYFATSLILGVSIVMLFFVRSPEVPSEAQSVSLDAIKEGIAFVWGRKVIFGAMTLDMFAVIFASVTALLPVYATEILAVGELGYGLLSASVQVGTVVMALLLLGFRSIQRPGRALLFAVVGFGLATILFGLSDSFPVAVAALILIGMADQVSMVTRSIILQLSTPDALRGRVNSVNMIFIGASNELGAAESGFLAAATSAVFAVVFGGVTCVAVVGAVAAGIPALWHYRIEPEPESSA